MYEPILEAILDTDVNAEGHLEDKEMKVAHGLSLPSHRLGTNATASIKQVRNV